LALDEGRAVVGAREDEAWRRLHGGPYVPDEWERARLISDISRVLNEPATPKETRTACLTLIGWLARRKPGEQPHALGIDEARESERRIQARKAAR
jgi:hypothetical protein